jgi:hypothetical protein
MSEQPPLVLHSKWVFAALSAGCLLYAYVFVELVSYLPDGAFVFSVYALFGAGLVYTTWASANVIELSQDGLAVSAMLGLGSPTKLKMDDVRRMLVRPNNFNRVTRVVLEFADGRKVQLHQYQKNFEAARMFLTDNLGSVPCEVQSKWAL